MDIVNAPYWVFQYLQVLFGYIIIEFVWPHVVFRKYLHQKSLIYRFSFCLTVQTVLINTVVLGLGLLHILNRWTMYAVFYGLFAFTLWRQLRDTTVDSTPFFHYIRISRIRPMLLRALRACPGQLKRLWRFLRPHLLEYLLLGGIVIYALIYLSWGAFQTMSYGFGDQYTHHSWIYGLMQGKVFSGGIYPQAMHCLLYTIYTLLGIRMFSLILFFGSVQGVVFLLSGYCLLRELFTWRYTPIFVLAAIMLLDLPVQSSVNAVSRLQWTLPLEFGLSLQILCALFLLRYLQSTGKTVAVAVKGKKYSFLLNRELFIFMMALAGVFAAHFYPFIMAFFMCVGVVLSHLRAAFSNERFVPLVAAILSGLLLAGTPMMVGLLSGIPLERSIVWGIEVIKGTDITEESRKAQMEQEEKENQAEEQQTYTLTEKICNGLLSIPAAFRRGYSELVGSPQAPYYMALMLVISLLYLTLRLLSRFLPPLLQRSMEDIQFVQTSSSGYFQLTAITFVFILLYTAPYLKLPEIVLGMRMFTTIQLLLFGVAVVPLDFLFAYLVERSKIPWQEVRLAFRLKISRLGTHLATRPKLPAQPARRKIPRLDALSLLFFAVLCVWGTGKANYHGYLYQELTRYRSEVLVMDEIIRKYPEFQYTLVSPTDGLYHVIEHGWHEELLDFINKASDDKYFIPTKHVFILLEKRPLRYAQLHFFQGPAWLALEKYTLPGSTQAPDIHASKISIDAAQTQLETGGSPFSLYRDFETRTIIESKAYRWCQAFAELYPHEMQVYYEDDDLICYHFEQQPNSPYNLAIDYESYEYENDENE